MLNMFWEPGTFLIKRTPIRRVTDPPIEHCPVTDNFNVTIFINGNSID